MAHESQQYYARRIVDLIGARSVYQRVQSLLTQMSINSRALGGIFNTDINLSVVDPELYFY